MNVNKLIEYMDYMMNVNVSLIYDLLWSDFNNDI